jgi:hypothetical protein
MKVFLQFHEAFYGVFVKTHILDNSAGDMGPERIFTANAFVNEHFVRPRFRRIGRQTPLKSTIAVEAPCYAGRVKVVGPVCEQLQAHHVDGGAVFVVCLSGLEFAGARFALRGDKGRDIFDGLPATFTNKPLHRFDPVDTAPHLVKNGDEFVSAPVFLVKSPKVL